MKLRHYSIILGSLLLISCARTQNVKVTQGDVDGPYDKIGVLEVSTAAKKICPVATCMTRVVTLGMVCPPPQGEVYRKKLDEILKKKAKHDYDAQAVIQTEYWPDLNSKSFPEGKIFARGTMIRYKKFPPITEPQPDTQ